MDAELVEESRKFDALHDLADLCDAAWLISHRTAPEFLATWPKELPPLGELTAVLDRWQKATTAALGLQPRDAALVAAMESAGFYFGRTWRRDTRHYVWGWHGPYPAVRAVASVWQTSDEGVVQDLTLESPCGVLLVHDLGGPHELNFPSVRAFLSGDLAGVTGLCHAGFNDTPWETPTFATGADGCLRCSQAKCEFLWRPGDRLVGSEESP